MSATKPQSKNAITLLTDDHEKVSKLFKQYEKLEEKGSASEKTALAHQICTELIVHMAIEEEIFYPAARKALTDEGIIDEADIEHAGAKALVTELISGKAGESIYDAKVKVLSEYIEHHVEEEQGEMFPKAKKAKLDLELLGEKMLARKSALESAPESARRAVLASADSPEKRKARVHQ